MFRKYLIPLLIITILIFSGCTQPPHFELLLTNGTIYDGTGNQGYVGSIGINQDTIAAVGNLADATADTIIDLNGKAVSPGFINMLSWAIEDLIQDGRSMGDIKQGVTLEVFGEGNSMGPLSVEQKQLMQKNQGDFKYQVDWNTLGEYLEFLESKGVSPNVASFVGATTLRKHQIGYADRAPTSSELDSMRALARQAMEEGALGIGSSLIYAPANYASTDELIALCEEAARYDGVYISHLRSEGNNFLEALDELLTIANATGIDAEIYHLKAAGKSNWPKMDLAIRKVDSARTAGLNITADMYTYTAGATGLDASMPPWVQEGGYNQWKARLKNPQIRARVIDEIKTPTNDWENLYLAAGSAEKVIFSSFRNDSLRFLTGKTLAEASELMNQSPEETMIDLVIADGSRVGTIYFIMSDENVKKKVALPWMRFGSDGGSMATEGDFLKSNPHPRSYGNFARLLGKYVREEKVIPLEEAIHKLTLAPASTLKIKNRGKLAPGYYADIVVFDPETIADQASFAEPHQYAIGVEHVWVNGQQVLRNGAHTGAMPGRVVRGPGWTGWKN